MDAFKKYRDVIEHLRGIIADQLDINHRHVSILSIQEGEKTGTFFEWERKYTVLFSVDSVQKTAIWTEYHLNNGEVAERIKLV